MSDGNSGRKWLAIAATAGLTVGAGYVLYKYALSGDDEVEEQKPELQAKPLAPKVKSGSQFAFPSAAPAAPATPAAPSVTIKQIKEHKSSHSTKVCNHCNKKLTGLPMRCSQCKSAYYCSSACQKQAWSAHKSSCKTSGKISAETPSTETSVAAAPATETPAKEAPAEVVVAAASPAESAPVESTPLESAPVESAPAAEPEPAVTSSADTLQSVLADLLEEQAQARGGTIEGDMEKAVLHFIKGDLRASAAAFESLRTRAAAEGRADMEAETFKWRGLCFSRLREFDAAERIFRDGVAFCRTYRNKLAPSVSEKSKKEEEKMKSKEETEKKEEETEKKEEEAEKKEEEAEKKEEEAEKKEEKEEKADDSAKVEKSQKEKDAELADVLLRLQVECQQQLGVALRNARQIPRAVDALKDALILADKTNDDDMKATVICNLGSVMMETDEAAEGIVCLQTAVQIRANRVEKLLALPEEDAEATRGLLGQAILEHATALVNLASALFSTGKFVQARAAYEQTLAIFEMVGDADKMGKVLVNLANMAEMQLQLPEDAAKYRRKLLEFLDEMGQPKPPSSCPLCQKPLAMEKPAVAEGDKIIMLGCLHAQHDACFQKAAKAAEEEGRAPSCPVCKGSVALIE